MKSLRSRNERRTVSKTSLSDAALRLWEKYNVSSSFPNKRT
jgi:hypothetical protein